MKTEEKAREPIEFSIPCAELCKYENVKNFTRLDGSTKHFIETFAIDTLKAELDALKRENEDLLEQNLGLSRRSEDCDAYGESLQVLRDILKKHINEFDNPKVICPDLVEALATIHTRHPELKTKGEANE